MQRALVRGSKITSISAPHLEARVERPMTSVGYERIPPSAWAGSLVRPETVIDWHGDLVHRKCIPPFASPASSWAASRAWPELAGCWPKLSRR